MTVAAKAPNGSPIVVILTTVIFAANGTAFAGSPRYMAMEKCVMMEWRKDHTHIWFLGWETDVMEAPDAILNMAPVN